MNRDERPSGSGPQLAAADDPMIGQVLDGRYQILRKLGEGGMGEVYAARHIRLGKEVALKLLRHEIVSNQEAVKRFEQEARSASSIGHKNIIGLLDSGELPDGRIYLSMELLEGAPLNELIMQPVAPDRLLNILIQTGHGLAAAHKKGIVHRDMKPENVYVTTTPEGEDVAKILDFGIAKVSGADGNNHLTKTGTIFGTPFYMAPEQALGQNVDQRADVYAVGVIMYECFCGAVPFQGESFMGILTQHITAEPKPPSRMAAEHGRTLPPGVEEIILHAMRKDPEHRYQSMDELIAALVGAYRTIAGAGMSTFLAAYPSSGAHAAPSSLPVRAAATPLPYGQGPGGPGAMRPPSGDSSSPYHMPVAPQPTGGYPGAPAHQPLSPLPQMASDSYVMPDQGVKKSRVGLIVTLIVILLGAAGAAGYFLFLNKGGEEKTAAAGGETGETTPPDPTSGKGVTPPPPAVADAGARVQTPPPPSIDAGSSKPPVVVKPPVIKKPKPMVPVLVNSRPQGADIIASDGKKIGTTPAIIKVQQGNPIKLTLRRRRHKDESITLDGTKEKETYTLERIGGRPGRPGGPGPDEGGTPEPDPGGSKDPCARPRSIECRCSRDPSLPECGLE